MTTEELYIKAVNNGCYLEATCADISSHKWDIWMKGAKLASKRFAVKIAVLAGVISEEDGKLEMQNKFYVPHDHYRTNKHLIYVHSSIEHFIRINDGM